MALIGNIPEFSCGCDDWNVYSERLDQFFEVNSIPDEKRSALLISVIGNDAYKTLRDLCHPALPKDKEFEELCDLLRKQFAPQVAIFRERNKFYSERQWDYESVSSWYARMKTLSVDCKFGERLESVLLDKFISGLRNPVVLDRICEEDETLTLAKAVEIAVNKESSIIDTPAWTRNDNPTCMRFNAAPQMAALSLNPNPNPNPGPNPNTGPNPNKRNQRNQNRNRRGGQNRNKTEGGSQGGSVCAD